MNDTPVSPAYLRREIAPVNVQEPSPENVCVYSSGLVVCSVCAPSSLTREQVEDATNRLHPTGISSRWTISADPTFYKGGPQPGPCDQSPDERTHYLMEC
jgi:hypothetical protein